MEEAKPYLKREDFEALENTKAAPKPELSFEDSLAAIQRAAAELVSLQQNYKENGRLTDAQRRKYSENLEKLGISAQKLANVQDEDDNHRLLFEGEFWFLKIELKLRIFHLEPHGDRIKGGSKKKPDNIKFPPYAKKPQAPAKPEECGEEEMVGEEGSDSSSTSTTTTSTATTTTTTKAPPSSSNNEAISVTSAGDDDDDNSSVAEAKPGKTR